jgi:hypothetical protein
MTNDIPSPSWHLRLRRYVAGRIKRWITWKRIVLVGIVLVFILLSSWYLSNMPPRINEQTYAKIRAGMTKNDVIALIGAPPGRYGGSNSSEKEYRHAKFLGSRDLVVLGVTSCWWEDDRSEICVQFGVDGRILSKGFADAPPPGWRERTRNNFERILRFLHLVP